MLIVGEKLDPSADRVMEKALDAVRKYAAGNITLEFPGGGSREVSHLSSRKMVPEVEGDRVDVYATLARIDEAFAKGEASVEAAGERVKPNVPRPSSLRWSCDGAR